MQSSSIILVPIWLVIALVLALSFAFAGPMSPTPDQVPDDELLMNYYRDPRPERLVGFMDRYSRRAASNWSAYPPAIGLFAVVYRKNPDWVERLMPSQFDALNAEAMDAALRLAGNVVARQSLQPRLAKAGSDAVLKSQLANLPSEITAIHVATPTHLDILWGAFFASGDKRYVRMIIDFLAKTANRSELIALDVARTSAAMSGGPNEILGQLKGKYGDALGLEIVFAATAAWALRSNGLRHERVANAMADYVSENPGTFATKVLSVLQTRPASPRP